tara:strand:- start:371 stop:751 length:381 start_codon:yes stop_codon:yes gene_type:complete
MKHLKNLGKYLLIIAIGLLSLFVEYIFRDYIGGLAILAVFAAIAAFFCIFLIVSYLIVLLLKAIVTPLVSKNVKGIVFKSFSKIFSPLASEKEEGKVFYSWVYILAILILMFYLAQDWFVASNPQI